MNTVSTKTAIPAHGATDGPAWFDAAIKDDMRIVYCENRETVIGLAYHNGRLVHFISGRARYIATHEALMLWSELEHLHDEAFADGGHDCKTRAKFLRTVAAGIK